MANKADNLETCVETPDPHSPGPGEFHFALGSYGPGSGDSSDLAAVNPLLEDENVEEEDTTNPSPTGCLNAGKLLPANVTPGEECATALNTVGIICDVTDMTPADEEGMKPWTTDIVGTWKKGKAHELIEKHSATCVTCVTECLDTATAASNVEEGT